MDAEVSDERVAGELVSGTYFPVLGVTPALGRVFDARDEQAPGANPVVVLSHRYWQDRFRSDPSVLGRTLRVNSHPMTIVGVARRGFDGTNLGSATDVFVPITMSQQLTPMETGLTDRQRRWLNVFGRLKPGVSATQAQAGLQPFYRSRLQFEVQQKGPPQTTTSARRESSPTAEAKLGAHGAPARRVPRERSAAQGPRERPARGVGRRPN